MTETKTNILIQVAVTDDSFRRVLHRNKGAALSLIIVVKHANAWQED